MVPPSTGHRRYIFSCPRSFAVGRVLREGEDSPSLEIEPGLSGHRRPGRRRRCTRPTEARMHTKVAASWRRIQTSGSRTSSYQIQLLSIKWIPPSYPLSLSTYSSQPSPSHCLPSLSIQPLPSPPPPSLLPVSIQPTWSDEYGHIHNPPPPSQALPPPPLPSGIAFPYTSRAKSPASTDCTTLCFLPSSFPPSPFPLVP